MITKFKLFELVDYGNFDLSDVKTYEGNLYYYSKDPITKKDITENSIFYPVNRADASDTQSEYIYQVKVKKPLFKRQLDFIFLVDLNEEEEINEKNFSGFFYSDSITSEWKCKIKPEDITSFKEIGGFVKYDTHNPDRIDVELSEKTDDWLYSYIGSGSLMLDTLTQDIIDELKPFRPDKPLKIYKGIEEVQIKFFSKDKPPYKKGQFINSNFEMATSWTTNILIARRFVDEYPSSPPFVITMVVDPKDVLVDVQKLPTQYYHTNQREIIVLPGEYEYKIIWEG